MTDKISLNENLAPIIDTIYSLGDKIDISFSDNENICVLCASIWELGIKMDRQMLRYSLNSRRHESECCCIAIRRYPMMKSLRLRNSDSWQELNPLQIFVNRL